MSGANPWWKRYSGTCVVGALQGSAAIYFGLLYLANDVPRPEELITFSVQVIAVHERDPHLIVALEDQSFRSLEFPTTIGLKSRSYYGIDAATKRKLVGCRGYVHGVPVRMTLGDRFRVWALECGTVKLTFTQTKADFSRHSKAAKVIYALYWVLAGLFTGFIFWSERRDRTKGISQPQQDSSH